MVIPLSKSSKEGFLVKFLATMAEKQEKILKPLNEFFYTWRVENSHLWWQEGDDGQLKSPTFQVDWLSKALFSLCLYAKGYDGKDEYISYFLCLENHAATDTKSFKVNLYLLAADGTKVEPESSEGFLALKKQGMLGCSRFISWRALMDKSSNYFPDETLTLICRIWSEVKPDVGKGKKSTEVKSRSDRRFARTQIKKEDIAKQMVIDNMALKEQKIGEMKVVSGKTPIAIFSASFGEISGHRSLNIDMNVKKKDEIKMACFKLMLIDEKRKKIFWENKYEWGDIDESVNIVLSSHFPRNSKRYAPHDMFVEKFLFLVCQIAFTTGLVIRNREMDDYGTNLNHLYRESSSSIVPTECPTLANAMMNMYADNRDCDVLIENGKVSIPAHKFVLYSRSSKFEAILKPAVNALPQVVKVGDETDTITKLKYFLYTDNIIPINWQIATTLYSTSMHYGIDPLKEKCCQFIKTKLDKSKVVEILLLAKDYNDNEMIASTRNFIMENRDVIYSSDEWDNFRKTHSDFAAEIMLPEIQPK